MPESAPETLTGKPSVLFVCVHNAGRSQMAAGWLTHLAGDRVEVRSAGSAPTEQVNPVAVEAMMRHVGEVGNASSLHAAGRRARRVVEESRERIAGALGCRPGEIVFTSGGGAGNFTHSRLCAPGSSFSYQRSLQPLLNDAIYVPFSSRSASYSCLHWALNWSAVGFGCPLGGFGEVFVFSATQSLKSGGTGI